MGDRDDGALVLREVLLEPADGFGVEVVGGLVEEEQIGGAEQEAREGDAALLTAGEADDRRVAGRAAQGVHGLIELLVDGPAVDGRRSGLQARELLGGLVAVVGGELVEAAHEIADLGEAVLDVAAHVLALVELGLLLEVADADAGGEVGLAAVLLVAAGHHLEDRGLARAVVAEHADLRSVEEREGEVLEDRLVRRMHLAEAVHLEDVLRSHAPRVPGFRGLPLAWRARFRARIPFSCLGGRRRWRGATRFRARIPFSCPGGRVGRA